MIVRGKEILEAARRRKESVEAERNAVEHRDLLRFSLDDEWYGVNIEDVVEVIKNPRIFNIPHTPDYVVGVINLKGEVLPIVDIRRLLGLPVTSKALPQASPSEHIVMVERNSIQVGIMVDRAADVVSISESEVKPPLSARAKAGGTRSLIAGEVRLPAERYGGEVLAIIDLEALVEEP